MDKVTNRNLLYVVAAAILAFVLSCSSEDTTDTGAGASTAVGGSGGGQGGSGDSGGSGLTGGSGGNGGTAASGGMGGGGGTAMPMITMVTPPSGIVTTVITIAGSGFGSTQGTSTATVGGSAGTPSSWADGQVIMPVPSDQYPGAKDVVITVGGNASNAVSFEVTLPRTVYVGNDNPSPNTSVSAYAMDAAGALTAVAGSPFLTGDDAASYGGDSSMIVLHRETRRLFVSGDTAVAVFDIDPVTGALTAVANSPFSTGGSRMFGLTVDQAGAYLYTTNLDTDDISVLSIDNAGALTPIMTSPFTSTAPVTAHLMHNETFLAAANESSALFVYSINAVTKALTPVMGSPFAIGDTFHSKANPAGTRVYVPARNPDQIEVFDIDMTTGAAAAIAGSPFAVTTTDTPHGMAFTSDGARLYMGVWGGNELFAYDIGATGAPTKLAAAPFTIASATATTMGALAFTRDDAFLVVDHENDDLLSVLSIAMDGTPTEVAGSPFAMDVMSGDASGVVIAE